MQKQIIFLDTFFHSVDCHTLCLQLRAKNVISFGRLANKRISKMPPQHKERNSGDGVPSLSHNKRRVGFTQTHKRAHIHMRRRKSPGNNIMHSSARTLHNNGNGDESTSRVNSQSHIILCPSQFPSSCSVILVHSRFDSQRFEHATHTARHQRQEKPLRTANNYLVTNQ